MCDICGLEHPLEPPLSIVVWQTPRLLPDNCEALGSGETQELGDQIVLSLGDAMVSI